VTDYITTSEAARRLGVPPADLYRAIAAGDLAAARSETGRVVVRVADARQALDLDDAGVDPLDEVEQRARAAVDDLERRDAAIVAAYLPPTERSLAEIGRRAGLSVEGVRQVLVRAGVELRPRGRRSTS